MKKQLSLRLLLWVGMVLLLIISLDSYFSWRAMDVRFQQLETRQLNSKLKSINSLVEERVAALARAAGDYGRWDDTWQFVSVPNSAYEQSTFTKEVLSNLDIDGFWLIRNDLSVRVAAMGARLTGEPSGELTLSYTRFPQIDQVLNTIRWSVVNQQIRLGKQAGQVIFWGNHPLLVGISPILKNEGVGPQRGYVLMMKVLDRERLVSLYQLTDAEFMIRTDPSLKTSISFADDLFKASYRNPDAISYGFALSMEGKRTSDQQRIEMLWLLVTNLVALWLVATFAIMKGVSRLVVRRVMRHVNVLKDYSDVSSGFKLIHEATDEVDVLAEHMNQLIGKVESQRDRLVYDATHDPLTKLANRKLLTAKMEEAKSQSLMSEVSFSLMLIDLDHFKNINDIHGHATGDDLLLVLSKRLMDLVPKSACVARLGGDEFAILLPGLDRPEEAQLLAKNILLNLQSGLMVDRLCFQMTASIGVVFVPPAQAENAYPFILMKKADIAMYRAKNQGRNSVVLFADWMLEFIEENARLESELAQTLAAGEMDFVVQPIVKANSLLSTEFEVLARWQHPRLGLVMPGTFIPIAENAHLMRSLTLTLLGNLCKLARPYLVANEGSRVSMNVSIQEMLEEGFVDELALVLRQNDFPGHWLNLEITESLLESNEESLLKPMNLCVAMGINFHLDDFGTGYSSLARLHSLPFSAIKVDRSFIARIGVEGDAIVEAIVRMAHALSLKVICEGVETLHQLEVIRHLKADCVQGYWVAKPMKFAEFLAWSELQRFSESQ